MNWLQKIGREASTFWPLLLKQHFIIVLQCRKNTDLQALVRRLALVHPIEVHWTHSPTYIELDFVGTQEELNSCLQLIPSNVVVGYHKA